METPTLHCTDDLCRKYSLRVSTAYVNQQSFVDVSCLNITSQFIHGRYVDTVLLSKISLSISQRFT